MLLQKMQIMMQQRQDLLLGRCVGSVICAHGLLSESCVRVPMPVHPSGVDRVADPTQLTTSTPPVPPHRPNTVTLYEIGTTGVEDSHYLYLGSGYIQVHVVAHVLGVHTSTYYMY